MNLNELLIQLYDFPNSNIAQSESLAQVRPCETQSSKTQKFQLIQMHSYSLLL